MQIAKLRIVNFLGCDLLELDGLGKLTVISGPNGAGKSTILRAVATLLGGSKKQPGLLRVGAEEGEIYAQLSDGTEISRRITEEGAREAVVKDARFHQPVAKPESYLKRLADALALDPVAFISAPPREKVQVLLDTFPTTVPVAQFIEAVGPVADAGEKPTVKEVGLAEVDMMLRAVRDERTAANGARTKAKKTVEQMRETLPPAAEEKDWGAEAKRLEGVKAAAEKDRDERIADCQALERAALELLLKERDEEMAKVRAAWEEKRAHVQQTTVDGIAQITAEAAPTLEGLAGKIAAAREKAQQAAGATKARELVDKLAKDAERLQADWEALNAAVARLEALKVEMCSRLPVKGVEVDAEGLTVRDGHGRMVRFESLNTAEQIKLAVRIAMQRSGELRAVLCDGLERLDPHAREAFLAEAEASGCQFMVAMATEAEGLTISQEGQP